MPDPDIVANDRQLCRYWWSASLEITMRIQIDSFRQLLIKHILILPIEGKRSTRPPTPYGAGCCSASLRNGKSESIWLLRQVGSFSRVSRNHAAGSSPLSFAVASKL